MTLRCDKARDAAVGADDNGDGAGRGRCRARGGYMMNALATTCAIEALRREWVARKRSRGKRAAPNGTVGDGGVTRLSLCW